MSNDFKLWIEILLHFMALLALLLSGIFISHRDTQGDALASIGIVLGVILTITAGHI